jgi:hypothetical protein
MRIAEQVADLPTSAIYTHDGASAKFGTNSHEMAYSVLISLYDIFELDPKNDPILSDPRLTMHTK